ncbi:MAG: hypothetical protein KR126chlam3_00230 [Chlamydiae bacterium]|nr:hypothetical protein [Chlamydiota bacterium]
MASRTAKSAADIIVKDDKQKQYPIEYYLAQSGDCLDIMRLPMGPGAKNGFRKDLLTFLNHEGNFSIGNNQKKRMREHLIEEVWSFVQETEKKKFTPEFSTSKGFMQNLLRLIEKEKYPLLSVVLSKEKYQFILPKPTYTNCLIEYIPTKPLRWIAWVFLLPLHILEILLKKAFQC